MDERLDGILDQGSSHGGQIDARFGSSPDLSGGAVWVLRRPVEWAIALQQTGGWPFASFRTALAECLYRRVCAGSYGCPCLLG